MNPTVQTLFEENLDLIERLLRSVCRRHTFPAQESEEFASWAKLRLIDQDYAVLRKFRGSSSLSTYLTIVVANLFRDYRIHRWGKWRPSTEARRLGTVAVQLETLIVRDGRSVAEAVRTLRQGFGVEETADALHALAARLPQRMRGRQEVESERALERLADPGSAADSLGEMGRRQVEEAARRGLAAALAEMEAEDRLVLKLRFADGLAVSEIAAFLRTRAKPLYARIERALVRLRQSVETQGLTAGDLSDLIGWSDLDLRLDYGAGGESGRPRPSHQKEHSA